MATIKRVVTIAGALVLVILGGAVLYLSFADLSRFRPRVEALVRDATGRELQIGGDFELEVLPRPALVATDVTFANATWGASEPMLSAGRLAVEVGLWSLVSGPIRISKLEVQDATLLLEQNAAGEANWTLLPATPPEETADAGAETLPVVVEVASLANFEVQLRRPDRDELRVAVTAFELRTDARGVGTVDAYRQRRRHAAHDQGHVRSNGWRRRTHRARRDHRRRSDARRSRSAVRGRSTSPLPRPISVASPLYSP